MAKLWAQVEERAKRYGRCRECGELVREYEPDGRFSRETLRDHLGHTLDEVTFVGIFEWLRLR